MPDTEPRVYFLYGNDEFAISRRMNEIQESVDGEGLNTARFDARAVSEDELNTAVNAVPFLAERRLVFLADPSAGWRSADERKRFLAFAASVAPTSLLVLHEIIDAREENRHWLLKGAEKFGIKTERFMGPRQWEMAGWIINETKKRGGKIEPQAAALLAEMVGESPRQASQEIVKLLTYVDNARTITQADVEKVSIVSSQGNVFAMVDALTSGETHKAQDLLHRLLEEEDPFALWGMVIRQFRLLLLAREIIDAGGSIQKVQKELSLHEFVAKKMFAQAQHYSLNGLEKIYRKLLVIDEEAKTGRVPLELALEMLVIELGG